MSGRYFSSYDGKTVMADVDVNGNSLELTIEDEKVKAIGNIPVGGGDESVWTDETFNALGDDNGDNILDENDEAIGDEDAETLWATRDGVGFKAKRAEADINGNSLELTIEDNKVVEIGGHTLNGGTIDAYTKTQTDALLADKADIISDGTENNLISLANDGNIKDSGIPSRTTAEGTSTLTITNTTVNNETTTTYGWGGWTSSSVVIPLSNKVTFGNIKYPYVKIGNLYWMTENLRNPIGNKNIDYWEYDNGSNPRKYGLIYKDTTVMKAWPDGSPTTEMAALLHDGWRIPTRGDFYNLGSGLREYDGANLLSVEDGGTDTKGFNGRLSGVYREAGHGYSDVGFHSGTLQLYTSEYYGAALQRYVFLISTGGGNPRITYGNGLGGETYLYCCLRLCCNAN
jgi:uncharacterized protein (TIGR02145 family)